MKRRTESTRIFIEKEKKSMPKTTLTDNSTFNEAHVINKQSYKPTN